MSATRLLKVLSTPALKCQTCPCLSIKEAASGVVAELEVFDEEEEMGG